MNTSQWYYVAGESQIGPVSEADLQQLVTSQAIQGDTFVWCDGMGEWQTASTVLPNLFEAATLDYSAPVVTEPTPAPDAVFAPEPSVTAQPLATTAGASGVGNSQPANSNFNVGDAYRASSTSQPALRGEVYSMTLMQTLFSFEGRIRRSAYWGYSIAVTAVFLLVGYAPLIIWADTDSESILPVIPIMVLFIPFVWMSLAIRVKRWHDRGKSGAWVLISFIPYVGDIWAFVENGCLDGDYGTNIYGPDPKGRQASNFNRAY